MKTTSLLIALAIVLLPAIASAQYLNGNILNESGGAAAAVNIKFKNNKNAVITNVDGSFKILATVFPDTLVFSAPGYEPYTVVVNEKDLKDPKFEVVLLNKREALSEVIVTGYSGVKKNVGSTSVASVSGKAAGISVGSATAASPGSIRIRGTASSPTYSYGSYADDIAGDRRSVNNSSFHPLVSSVDSLPVQTTMSSLTAGEVNDFYKWKMWTDLSNSEFKTWSQQWSMYTAGRYTVQVQNKGFAAIVNYPVYLVNKKTKIKTWSARTDNTGKAELWGGLNNNDSVSEYSIVDDKGNEIRSAVLFDKGINHLTVKAECNSNNEVDIAFVVDATGSMSDEIEFLKFELENVVRQTYSDYANLDLKTAGVFYRDRGDAYVTKSVDFQSDLLKLLNFVKLQGAGGGGDTPEAVDSALSVALEKLTWRSTAKAKLLFLFLDAPPHDYAMTDIHRLVAKAASMGVRIIPIACSGSSKDNEFLLRSIALATNGTYAFLTDHSGVGSKHLPPTTDSYSVELLNGLMKRIIRQFIYTKDCSNNLVKPFVQAPENVLKVKVFPNPSRGPITIESTQELKEVFITDFTGKILMKLANQKSKIWRTNISNYPSGTYLVKYITSDNRWGAEQLVLIH